MSQKCRRFPQGTSGETSRYHPLRLPSPPVHLGNRAERVGNREPQCCERITACRFEVGRGDRFDSWLASMLMRNPHRWVRPKRKLPPGFIVPSQPTLADKVPEGDGSIHELKHDGFRILAFKDGDKVRLWSRNGRDWSAEFVAITAAMRALPFKRIMLDGEAVAHCLEGLPDFHRLLGDGQATACFYAFDLLWLEVRTCVGWS